MHGIDEYIRNVFVNAVAAANEQTMSNRPTFKTSELKHRADCGVNDLTFCDKAVPTDCTCGAVIDWYEMVLQAVFDPENQPSQFGTTNALTAPYQGDQG